MQIALFQNDTLVAQDHITISGKVTDAYNNPVADDTVITFTVKGTHWSKEINGSLSTDDSDQGLQTLNVKTHGGWANVSYGWISRNWSSTRLWHNNSTRLWHNNNTIVAYCLQNSSVSGSIVVPCYKGISVIAFVVDSFGVGIGDVNATFHEMGNNGESEIYNMTTTTRSKPDLGLYVFDKVVLYPSFSHFYVTANVSIGNGIIYRGYTNNYTMSPGIGSIVVRVPHPDAMNLSANRSSIVVGGHTSTITAQLMLNGSPYTRSGLEIYFSSDNDSIGYLPAIESYTTDKNGRVQIPFTSNMSIGDVNITAYCHTYIIVNGTGTMGNLTDTYTVHVIG